MPTSKERNHSDLMLQGFPSRIVFFSLHTFWMQSAAPIYFTVPPPCIFIPLICEFPNLLRAWIFHSVPTLKVFPFLFINPLLILKFLVHIISFGTFYLFSFYSYFPFFIPSWYSFLLSNKFQSRFYDFFHFRNCLLPSWKKLHSLLFMFPLPLHMKSCFPPSSFSLALLTGVRFSFRNPSAPHILLFVFLPLTVIPSFYFIYTNFFFSFVCYRVLFPARPKPIGPVQNGGPPRLLEESDPAGCDFVCDRLSMLLALTDLTTCPGLRLIYISNCTQKHRHELRHARKELPGTLVDPCLLSGPPILESTEYCTILYI